MRKVLPKYIILFAAIFPALDPVLKALGFGKNRSEEMQFILQTICNTIEERKKTSANEKVCDCTRQPDA